jgi:hypothetical protein
LIKLELTAEEAQVLTNMIDVAVKAAGLQAAEAGVHFVKKIKEAQEAAKSPVPSVEEPAP